MKEGDFRCLVPIFLLDTVFFPEVLQRDFLQQASHVFLGDLLHSTPWSHCNYGTSPLILNDDLHFQAVGGTILFMVGSAFFAFASFVNGLNQRSFDTLTNQLLTAVTSMYLGVGLSPRLKIRLGLVYISHKKPGTALFGC